MKLKELLKTLCYDKTMKASVISDEIIIDIEIINDNFSNQLKENVLYIIEAGMIYNLDLNNNSIYNFIVVEKDKSHIQKDDVKSQHNIIYLPSHINENTVYNELTSILYQETLDHLKTQELYKFLTLDDYYEPLLDKTFQLLGNPIQCTDYSHKVIGERHNDSIKLTIWNRVSTLGYVEEDVIDNKFYENVKQMNESKNYVTTSRDGIKIIIFPMFIRNYYLGCIAVLEEYRKIQESDLDILKIVAKILSVKYAERNLFQSVEASFYNSILEDLIEHKIKNQSELETRLKSRNWKERNCNRIILIKNDDHSSSNIRYIKQKIMNISPTLKVMQYNDYILILEEFQTDVNEIVYNKVINYITKSNFTAGISNTFKGLLNLSVYYGQAKKALYYNNILHLKQSITHYFDFQLYDFLREISEKVDCENFYSKSIMEIDDYDKQHHTELGKTLFEYLTNDQSIKKTCSNMHLHKNTIIYRINKIKEIFDIDFDDNLKLFLIELSFMIKNLPEQINTENC